MAWISGKDPSTETQDYVSETQLCPQQAKQIRTGDRTSLSSLLEIEVSVPLAQGHRDKGNKWHLLCKGLDALLLNGNCGSLPKPEAPPAFLTLTSLYSAFSNSGKLA